MTAPETKSPDSAYDEYEVTWDGDADPENPMNWSAALKWTHIGILSILIFVVCLASSMLAPGIPEIMSSLGSSDPALSSFILSSYVVGFILGPFLTAPLSEMYGRSVVYQASNLIYIAFAVGAALSTTVGMLIAFRLLTGCVGTTPVILGGASIGDIMPPESRGTAMALWGMGALVAPILAPIAGGYLIEAAGWRWVFWVIVIAIGVIAAVSPFILYETYGPVILERRAKRIRKDTGDSRFRISSLGPETPMHRIIMESFARPIKFLFTSPITAMLSAHLAVAYAWEYLMITTLSSIYLEEYNFSSGSSGLTYIASGIGSVLAVLILGPLSDKIASRDKKLGKAVWHEKCLWPLIPGTLMVSGGLFWYGWALEAHTNPVLPLVGTGVFGFGVLAIWTPMLLYLVAVFEDHSASALAANAFLRNLCGALVPLGGQDLYRRLGFGWGNSLLAIMALALLPVPWVIMRHGPRLKEWDRNLRKDVVDV